MNKVTHTSGKQVADGCGWMVKATENPEHKKLQISGEKWAYK